MVTKAKEFAKGYTRCPEIVDYGLKVLDKLYSPKMHVYSKESMAVSIVLHDVLISGADIEEIQEKFGDDAANIIFNITDQPEDTKISAYERLFKGHAFLFVKLIIRIAHIHDVIHKGDGDKFKDYIHEYNELRRKILKEVDDLMVLMDYESELIKYGRHYLSGRQAKEYNYSLLIV